jgi:hypothetical protein
MALVRGYPAWESGDENKGFTTGTRTICE